MVNIIINGQEVEYLAGLLQKEMRKGCKEAETLHNRLWEARIQAGITPMEYYDSLEEDKERIHFRATYRWFMAKYYSMELPKEEVEAAIQSGMGKGLVFSVNGKLLTVDKRREAVI